MPLQYVSLLNTPFSGSTVVSMLLCSQPRIIGFGDTYVNADPRHYPKFPCTCGLWYDRCPPRAAITKAIRLGGLPHFEWDRASPSPVPKGLPWKFRKNWPLAKSSSLPIVHMIPRALRKSLFRKFYLENTLMLQALEDDGGYDFYFDGCKDLVRFELLRSAIENIKVLHVIRHPGAYLYHFHKLGEAHYARRLRHWVRYNQYARNVARLVPIDNYLAVTYEFIVQKPELFVARIEKYFGMTETHSIDRARLRTSQIHITGNRMRESAEQVQDHSNNWRGKMPIYVEQIADQTVAQNDWLRSLYHNADAPIQ